MVAHALLGAGVEPGYLIGGALRTTGENADWGDGRLARRRGRRVGPLDARARRRRRGRPEHRARPPRDLRRSLAELHAAFDAVPRRRRARRRRPRPSSRAPATPTSTPQDADLRAGGSRFTWRRPRGRRCRPRRAQRAQRRRRAGGVPRSPGAADLTAAVAALADFAGAGRRFERLGTTPSGAQVVDDYAHHPTEVAATIAAARSLRAAPPRRRLPAAPLSRTQELHREFGAALARRRRRRRARRLPGPRARRGLPRRDRQADRRGRRRPRARPSGLLAADARRGATRPGAAPARRRPRPRAGRRRRRPARPRARRRRPSPS